MWRFWSMKWHEWMFVSHRRIAFTRLSSVLIKTLWLNGIVAHFSIEFLQSCCCFNKYWPQFWQNTIITQTINGFYGLSITVYKLLFAWQVIRSSSLALKEEPELDLDLDNGNDLVANQNNLAVGFCTNILFRKSKNLAELFAI